MKKFSLLLLTMALLLLCSAQASNIDKAVLTAEPWVNPFGTQLVFGANSKGKMVAPTGDVTNFDYEVSGDSVTYTYKFWGDFTTGATFVYGEEDGIRFLCLDEAGKLTSASYYQASKIDTVRQMAEEKLETYAVQFGEKLTSDSWSTRLKRYRILSRLRAVAATWAAPIKRVMEENMLLYMAQ